MIDHILSQDLTPADTLKDVCRALHEQFKMTDDLRYKEARDAVWDLAEILEVTHAAKG